MRTHSRANNDYMLFVEVEVTFGEVQMEQQFLASEEPSGFGRRTYLSGGNGEVSVLFPVSTRHGPPCRISTVKSAVPVFNRFTEHGTLISQNACIHRDILNRYHAKEMKK